MKSTESIATKNILLFSLIIKYELLNSIFRGSICCLPKCKRNSHTYYELYRRYFSNFCGKWHKLHEGSILLGVIWTSKWSFFSDIAKRCYFSRQVYTITINGNILLGWGGGLECHPFGTVFATMFVSTLKTFSCLWLNLNSISFSIFTIQKQEWIKTFLQIWSFKQENL